MRIAVDARLLCSTTKDDDTRFTYNVLKALVRQKAEDEFIFFVDKPYNEEIIFNDNVKLVIIPPVADNPIKWYLWYEVKLRKALKKQQAEMLIAFSGLMPSAAKIPTLLILHQLKSANKSLSVVERRFYKKYLPKYLQSARYIISTSGWMKTRLNASFEVDAEKIKLIKAGADKQTSAPDWEAREAVKAEYAQEQEYFVYAGTINKEQKLPALLKAFSAMKKRLRSNVQLLIVGQKGEVNLQLQELLKNFYFRKDVRLICHLDDHERFKIVHAAYAFVSPAADNNFSLAALEALKAGVPVIAVENSALAELAGEAGLYFSADNEEDLANQMALVYKDERLRTSLVNHAEAIGKNLDWEKTAEELSQLIDEVVG